MNCYDQHVCELVREARPEFVACFPAEGPLEDIEEPIGAPDGRFFDDDGLEPAHYDESDALFSTDYAGS